MRIALTVLTLVIAACAPADHNLTPEAGPQAGSVALGSEALAFDETAQAASCSAASYCSKVKSFVNANSGTTWTWSGACLANTNWTGTAPGGRTGTATGYTAISLRKFALSQQWTRKVGCMCWSNNSPTCQFVN